MVSGNDAHGEAGPEYWTTLNPCAEPLCEAAENPSPVSSVVLVTVKSIIYSNKRYSVFGNMCKKTDGDNGRCGVSGWTRRETEVPVPVPRAVCRREGRGEVNELAFVIGWMDA